MTKQATLYPNKRKGPLKESFIRLYERIIFIGQMLWFLRIKNRVSKFMRSSVSNNWFQWSFYSIQWAAVFRLTYHCCTLTCRADVYCIWISDTGSWNYSNLNDRSHSVSSGLCVLACGRRPDVQWLNLAHEQVITE